MPTRKPLSAPWIAVAVLPVLAMYVGTYYFMVRPRWGVSKFGSSAMVVPVYRFRLQGDNVLDDVLDDVVRRKLPEHSEWKWFFAPIHWLDRRVRPHVWERAYGLRDEEYLRLKILTCMLPEF